MIVGHTHRHSYTAPGPGVAHTYHLLAVGQDQVARVDATATALTVVVTGTDGKVIQTLVISRKSRASFPAQCLRGIRARGARGGQQRGNDGHEDEYSAGDGVHTRVFRRLREQQRLHLPAEYQCQADAQQHTGGRNRESLPGDEPHNVATVGAKRDPCLLYTSPSPRD